MNIVDAQSLKRRILSSRPPVVVLPFPGDVAVSFRTLSGNDLQALVARLDLPSVELAVETLADQAQDLPEAAAVLRQLPRPTLLRLLRSWAAHPNTLEAASSEIRSFADFKRIVKKKVDEWLHPISQLGQHLSKSMGLLAVPLFSMTLTDELTKIGAAAQNFSAMIAETARVTGVLETFRESLPDPYLMRQALQEGGVFAQATAVNYPSKIPSHNFFYGRLRAVNFLSGGLQVQFTEPVAGKFSLYSSNGTTVSSVLVTGSAKSVLLPMNTGYRSGVYFLSRTYAGITWTVMVVKK